VENEYSLLDQHRPRLHRPGEHRLQPPRAGRRGEAISRSSSQDIESVGDFIRLYVTRFKRWSSPKYLIGESYGTTRAVGLAGYSCRATATACTSTG
jgi:hypothetical protein